MALADIESHLLSIQDIERVASLGWDDDALGLALQDSSPIVRANAIQLLSKRTDGADGAAREAFLSSLLPMAADPSAEVRSAIQAVAVTESHPVAFSVLALGLLDGEQSLRVQALNAISKIPHADLIGFLLNLDAAVLDRACDPLSDAFLPRGEAVVSPLIDLLLTAQSASCRRFVAFTLGRFGRLAIDALNPLMSALRDDDALVRKLAIQALDFIVRGSEPQRPSLTAPPPPAISIEGFYTDHLDLEALAEQAPAYPAAVFADALRASSPTARANAAKALQSFDALDRAVMESLGIMLFDRDPAPRAAALATLRWFGPQAQPACPWLLSCLSGPYRRELRDEVLPFLIAQAQSISSYLVESLRLDTDLVVECIRPIFDALDANSMPILGDALKHPSALIRLNGLTLLRLLKHCIDADRMELLQTLSLRDDNVDVRLHARKTLLIINDARKDEERKRRAADEGPKPADEVISALSSLDGDPDPEVRRLAQNVMQQLHRQRPEPLMPKIAHFDRELLSIDELSSHREALAPPHLRSLLSHSRPHARANATLALSLFKNHDRETLQAIGLQTRDLNPAVRQAALTSLSRLGIDALTLCIEDVLTCLSDESEPLRLSTQQTLTALGLPGLKLLISALHLPTAHDVLIPLIAEQGEPAVPLLVEVLEKHPSVKAKSNAALALFKLGGKLAAPARAALQAAIRQEPRLKEVGMVTLRAIEKATAPPLLLDPKPVPFPAFESAFLTADDLTAQAATLRLDLILPLVSDGRPEVRANAARALAVLNHYAHDLPLLLKDSAPNVRLAAAESLRLMGAAALDAAPALISALQDPTCADAAYAALEAFGDAPKAALITALGFSPPASAARVRALILSMPSAMALLDEALSHPAVPVRQGALVAAAEAKGAADAAFTLIARAADDPDPEVRATAYKAKAALVEAIKPPPAPTPPLPIPHFEERPLSRKEIGATAAKCTPAQLMRSLSDGRDHVRENVARALPFAAKADLAASLSGLTLLLKDSVFNVRRAAAESLQSMGAAALDAAPALIASLNDVASADAAYAALEALGDAPKAALIAALGFSPPATAARVRALILSMPSAMALLDEALSHPATPVRRGALAAAAEAKGAADAAFALIARAADDPDPEVRAAAAKAKATLIEALKPLPIPLAPLPIPSFEDRALSVEEIAPTAAQCTLAQLMRYLSDGREHVRENVARALVFASKSDPDAALGALSLMLKDSATSVRIATAEALGTLKAMPSRTIPILASALPAPDMTLSQALLASIESFGDDALGPILSLLYDDWDRLEFPLLPMIKRRAEVYYNRLTAVVQDHQNPPHVRANAQRTIQKLRSNTALLVREPEPMPVAGFDQSALGEDVLKKHLKQLNVDQLIRFLQDGRAVVRENATRAISLMGAAAERGLIHLTLRLKDASPEVRVAAVRSLGLLKMDPSLVVPRLIGVLQGAPAELSTQILGVLQIFGVAAVEPVMLLLDARWRQVDPALVAVVQHMPDVFTKPLGQIVQSSPSIQARENALDLLAYIGAHAAPIAPILLAAIAEKKGMVRPKAIRALSLSGTKIDPKLATQLKGYLNTDLRVSVKRAVLDALRASGHMQDDANE
jgi:HEAT repeat protein